MARYPRPGTIPPPPHIEPPERGVPAGWAGSASAPAPDGSPRRSTRAMAVSPVTPSTCRQSRPRRPG